MKRRDLIAGLLSAVALRVARAWAAPRQARIAFVHTGIPVSQLTAESSTLWIRAFFERLRALGYIEGRNLVVERYSAEGDTERFAALALSVVAQKPGAIVLNGPLIAAFRAATRTIPIVAIMGDPLRLGFVASLARPGGNLTGVSIDAGLEVYGKQLQILKEAVPTAVKIAFLESPAFWNAPATEQVRREAALTLGISPIGMTLTAVTPARLRDAFAEMAEQRIDAVWVSSEGEYLAERQLIVDLARAARLPGIYPYRDFVEAGGFMAYSPDLAELATYMAGEVRDILDGADPGNIPIYQVTTFKLIVNVKAAQAIGLAFPREILAQADEIIE